MRKALLSAVIVVFLASPCLAGDFQYHANSVPTSDWSFCTTGPERPSLDKIKQYLLADQFDAAIAEAKNIRSRTMWPGVVNTQIAIRYAETGQYEKAYQYAVDTIGWDEFKVSLMKPLAVAYAYCGQPEWGLKVADHYDTVWSSDVCEAMVQAALEKGDLKTASVIADSVKGTYMKGRCLTMISEKSQSAGKGDAAFTAATKIDPKIAGPELVKNIRMFADKGESDKADALYNMLVRDEDRAFALVQLSAAALSKKDTEKAVRLLDQSLALADSLPKNSNRVIVWQDVATAYADCGEFDKALKLAARIPGTEPSPDGKSMLQVGLPEVVYRDIAQRLSEQGRKKEALEIVQTKVPEMERMRDIVEFKLTDVYQPRTAGEYKALGDAYISHDENAKAEELQAKALQLAPDDPQALMSQATALFNEGKYEQSIASLTKVIDSHPEMAPMARYSRAMAYMQLKKFSLAWDDINKTQLSGFESAVDSLKSVIRPFLSKEEVEKYENNAWKEASCKKTLEDLTVSIEVYQDQSGGKLPVSLEEFREVVNFPYLPDKPERIGYRFEYKLTSPTTYVFTAVPVQSGLPEYFVDQSKQVTRR